LLRAAVHDRGAVFFIGFFMGFFMSFFIAFLIDFLAKRTD
jgi:uncharacterized protein involved in exopolysaccharide biosynthesis